MCTRYITPEQAAVERHWHVGRGNLFRWPKTDVFPGRPGLFIRAARDTADAEREAVIGQ